MYSRSLSGGFTLVEAVVAFGIIFIAAISLHATLSGGLKATRHSGRMTEAVNYGRQLVELIRVRNLPFNQDRVPPARESGLNDRLLERRPLAAPPFGNSDFAGLPETANFRRNIRMERVSDSSESFEYHLMKITVTVYWSESGDERSVQLSTYHRQP